MGNIDEIRFIVVDVETTGSDAKNNRITDIACIEVQNGKIISEFTSLINPHQSIPPFISQMTGITYDMVINAPEATKICKTIRDIFDDENVVFTAHNARFDFNFVNQMLQREGFERVSTPVLCTLKIARRLLPRKQRKNVGALSEYFEIPIKNRHRAFGDAFATSKFLIQLLEIARDEHDIDDIEALLKFQNKQLKHFQAPSPTQKRVGEQLENLPDSPGIYKFLNKKNDILYIGKAKTLRDRIKSYFHTDTFTSKKIARMFTQIQRIEWECTSTELEALILESRLIKKHKPHYNTIDKKYKSYPFIKLNLQLKYPYIETSEIIEPDGAEYYGPIRSMATAENIVRDLEKKFKIRKCDKQFGNSTKNKPCFYFHIQQCYSPCSGEITESGYLKEVEKVRSYLSGKPEGIIKQLERRMNDHADKMEFEKAEMLKRSINELNKMVYKSGNIPASVNSKNIIALTPSDSRDKTIDVFFIRHGMLLFHRTVGRKASLSEINNNIREIYFSGNEGDNKLSREDIDEIRIISNWFNRQNGMLDLVYIDGKDEEILIEELENSIRTMKFSEDEGNDFSEAI